MKRLIRSWILPGAVLTAVVGASPAAASLGGAGAPAGVAGSSAGATGAASAHPAVKVCGAGAAVVRPRSMILTCADDGELAGRLSWTSWSRAEASATGIVTWRACRALCADSKRWDSTSADYTLTDPVRVAGQGWLFTRLELHVTGTTPHGFMRNLAFDEAPATISPPRQDLRTRQDLPPAAPSGMLGYAAIEGYWLYAGGPDGSAGGYNDAQVAAAITGAESSFLPGIIQPDVDYCGAGADRAGWGLWQITCGNSVPQYGTDFQILDPWNNAEEAVYKCDQDVAAGFNCFDPWSTYASGAYEQYLQHTDADMSITDPGEYVQVNSTPSGTPSSPPADPGSTYGPPMPNAATSYVFWKGTGPGDDLWEAQGSSNAALSGPTDQGMGALNSAPAAGVNSKGYTYVYWEGNAPQDDLWEAYWNGSKWVGPFNRGMGPLGSAPAVAVSPGGTAYVFWKGQNGDLYEASGPATGALSGPTDRGMGPLGSAPAVGIDSSSSTYVYWEGTAPQDDLYEAYWNGSKFVGPYDRGMGPLGSAPAVAVTGSGTAYVFWKGGSPNYDLWQAQGPATGSLSGPFDRGMGPLNSAPAAGVGSNGYTYIYWEGNAPQDDLWEGFWNGSEFSGPVNRGMGPLNSAPTVAVSS
jgi:hypothetical protein